ncbi:MAG: hypothetical protein QOF54_689, partial [Solirubrobacteraceae bacterium]|nr:hypothetical protein [Solirubrobacteraceae bacterium]
MQRTATPSATPASTRTRTRALARSATTALVLCAVLAAAGASSSDALASAGSSAPTQPTPSAVGATLEQCATSGVQSERSATFTGEMTATAGTARMAMRIDIEERAAGDVEYH